MSEPTEVSIEHLRQNLSAFQRYLDIDIIAPTLRDAQLLTDVEEWYLTNHELSPKERITQLLMLVLGRKGKRGASIFIECIRRTSDCHLPHECLVQLFRGKFRSLFVVSFSKVHAGGQPALPYVIIRGPLWLLDSRERSCGVSAPMFLGRRYISFCWFTVR